MYGYVYKTTNLVNGKIYVGQKKSETFLGAQYLGSGKILTQAVSKYGAENFVVEMLHESTNQEDLNAMEICYIYNFRQLGYEMYNIADGGNGGDIFHTLPLEQQEEIRRKLSLNSGMKMGSEGRQKREKTLQEHPEILINAAKKKQGHVPWNKGLTSSTDERIKTASQKVLDYYKTHSPHQLGKPRTQEEKEKISAGMRGKKNGLGNRSITGYVMMTKDKSNTAIPQELVSTYLAEGWVKGFYREPKDMYNAVFVYCLETDTTYHSYSEAARATGVSNYFIVKSIKENKSYKGYTFKLASE